MICHRLPSFSEALCYRVVNSIKHLSQKHGHSITLIFFKHSEIASEHDEEYLKEYCDEIMTVDIIPVSFKKRFERYVLDYVMRILSRDIGNFWDYTFSREMQRRVNELIQRRKFDVIFVDTPYMLSYVSNIDLPKVLEIWTIPQIVREAYTLEKKIQKKINLLMLYFRVRNYEKHYKKFDICITPTEHERNVVWSYLPDLEIAVIPFGINVEFTNKTFIEDFPEDFPSLIFIGSMDSLFNQRSILYFYDKIYPLIKETFPDVKLYIVGRDPSEKIMRLTRDKSVIVTGYVEDLRPYLARASVVTLPLHGYGIKTRILEVMAIGKPVVTSSEGIHGINVTPRENIILADEPEEFARRVIELLNDEELRNRIGANGRKLMEEEYSWEKMTDMLNEVLQKAVSRFYEK